MASPTKSGPPPTATTTTRPLLKMDPFVIGVSACTRLRTDVVRAWQLGEGGPKDNPLNIGPGKHYGTTAGAVAATCSLLHDDLYKGILNSAKSNNADTEIAAIAASPWCGGSAGCPGYTTLLTGTLRRARGEGYGESVGSNPVQDIVNPPGDPISNAFGAAADVGSAILEVVKLLRYLFEPSFWLRMAKLIGGFMLLAYGVTQLGKALLGVDLGKIATAVASRGAAA